MFQLTIIAITAVGTAFLYGYKYILIKDWISRNVKITFNLGFEAGINFNNIGFTNGF